MGKTKKRNAKKKKKKKGGERMSCPVCSEEFPGAKECSSCGEYVHEKCGKTHQKCGDFICNDCWEDHLEDCKD
jgi:hypothetical protein